MEEQLLSKPWRNFLKKFEEIETTPEHEWQPIHLLSYFCKRYAQHFGFNYALSFQGPPSKCTEIVLLKKIYVALETVFPTGVKNYIDWIYDRKIIPNKLNIRNVSFCLTNGVVNEYKKWVLDNKKVNKSMLIPEEYKQIAEFYQVSISTWGELAFIKKALEQDSDSDSRKPYKKLLDQLCSIGLKLETLDKL